jgi:ppGpp synthetase/RelA/SpoT-type nucleotidyltranferase
MKISKSFEDEYKTLEPILKRCCTELESLVRAQIAKIHNPALVRIRLSESRVKSLPSLLRKAKKKKWKRRDILKEAKDIIGLRIVCANIEDIRRVRELLLSYPRLKEIPHSEEDRTINPTPSGYRDYKFYVSYETGHSPYPSIICEIQIRTILQDGWATLSYKDIYKEGDDLPKSLKKLSYRLSELLHVADQIAQDIRGEVSRKREPLKRGDKIITENGLTLIYKKAFEQLPSDYLTRLVRNMCEDLGIVNIKSIKKILLPKKIRKLLYIAIHAKTTGRDIQISPLPDKSIYYDDIIFQLSPFIAAYGIEIATDAIGKLRGQAMPEGLDWEEQFEYYLRRLTLVVKNGIPQVKVMDW